MSKTVTIVIPNYNGLRFLKPCLDSIREQTYKDIEVLIVDNASADDSVQFIKENYPEVILKVMKKNYGFSGAVNAGIKASTAPYIFLLNNDTTIEPDCVENLVRTIEKSDRTFSVACKMIQMYNPQLLDSAGDEYTLMGWGVNRGVGRPIGNYIDENEVFSACAGAALYRREVFDEIGLFDLKHFAYLEDMDVCWRALIYGYRNVYCPDALVYHVGSGTSGSKYNTFKVKLAARNNIYLNYKNQPIVQLIINLPWLIAGTVVKAGFFAAKGFGKDYIAGLRDGLRSYKRTQKVAYDPRHLINYIAIEIKLIRGTFNYVTDWVRRHTTDKEA